MSLISDEVVIAEVTLRVSSSGWTVETTSSHRLLSLALLHHLERVLQASGQSDAGGFLNRLQAEVLKAERKGSMFDVAEAGAEFDREVHGEESVEPHLQADVWRGQ